MKQKSISRGKFLHLLAGAVLSVPAAFFFKNCTRSSPTSTGQNPPPGNGTELTLDLTASQYAPLALAGGAVYVSTQGQAKPLIVHRISAAEVAAFSSACTHQGCQVGLPNAGVITCPCHFSRYNGKGEVISGPAAANLHSFAARIEDQAIVVTLS